MNKHRGSSFDEFMQSEGIQTCLMKLSCLIQDMEDKEEYTEQQITATLGHLYKIRKSKEKK